MQSASRTIHKGLAMPIYFAGRPSNFQLSQSLPSESYYVNSYRHCFWLQVTNLEQTKSIFRHHLGIWREVTPKIAFMNSRGLEVIIDITRNREGKEGCLRELSAKEKARSVSLLSKSHPMTSSHLQSKSELLMRQGDFDIFDLSLLSCNCSCNQKLPMQSKCPHIAIYRS